MPPQPETGNPVDALAPVRHKMWAHHLPKGFQHVYGYPQAVKMCGDEPIVPVIVTERPDLPLPKENYKDHQYIGWVDARDGKLTMIQPCWGMFSMQFPHVPEAYEKRGEGRAVCLDIEIDPEPRE